MKIYRKNSNNILTVYRGEGSHNKNGRFFTLDKEWARQFTQSGRDSEILTRTIPKDSIYVADPLPKAYGWGDEEFDKCRDEAMDKGFGAMLMDEGDGQPNSIFVFDPAILKNASNKFRFRNVVSQKITEHIAPSIFSEDYDEESLERAEQYFSIGHRNEDEYDDDEVFDIIWVLKDGRIDFVEIGKEDIGSHGMVWGHDFCNETYKGRYEPENGNLSIVKPDKHKHRDIPNIVMKRLMETFPDIKEVNVFS